MGKQKGGCLEKCNYWVGRTWEEETYGLPSGCTQGTWSHQRCFTSMATKPANCLVLQEAGPGMLWVW